MTTHHPSHVSHPPYRYAERTPSTEASRLVLSYWSFHADRTPPPDEPYASFPDGCASVACVRPGNGMTFVALVGPRVSPLRPPVTAGTRIWGIRFWPDAIGPALGASPRSIRDHFGDLPPGIRAEFAELGRALPESDDEDTVFQELDSWASRLLRDSPNPDPRVRSAIRAIVARRGEGAMEEIAREAAVGLRHLQRLFPDATGLTLREYARVRRLREALAIKLTPASPRWSHVAAGAGYVDHAHLAREFVALTGMPPSSVAQHLRTIRHHEVQP